MTIDEEHFDSQAPIHVPRKYVHEECSKGKDAALVVTKTETGWVWWCHRCKTYGFKSIKGLSPKQTVKFMAGNKLKPKEYRKNIRLPDDFTTDLPYEALAWLYAYITEDEIELYHIGYSPRLNRVILPVYRDKTLIYWQGRYLGIPDKDHPKYVNIYSSRSKNVYFLVKKEEYITTHSTPLITNSITLVEDIISAIVVGRVQDSLAILGVYIDPELVLDLHRDYDQINIWLDPDKHMKVIGYTTKFRQFGIDCVGIYSDKDPKYYNNNNIRRYLNA